MDMKFDDASGPLLVDGAARDETSDVVFRLDRWPVCICATGLSTVVVTFSIFYGRNMQADFAHDDNFVLPTISRTGGRPPSSAAFTLGLHVCAFQAFVIFLSIYHSTRQQSRRRAASSSAAGVDERKVLRWNARLLVVGMISCIGMIGTGTFYMSLQPWVHATFAAALFASGAVYCCLHTAFIARPAQRFTPDTARAGADEARFWYRYKVWVCVLSLVAMVTYVIVLNMLQLEEHCSGTTWCPVRNARSAVEYVLALSLFLYLGGLRHDLHGAVVRFDGMRFDDE
eukprot:g1783.t1